MKTAISAFTPDCKSLKSMLFYWQSSVSLSVWDLTPAFQSCCPGSVEKLNKNHWLSSKFPGFSMKDFSCCCSWWRESCVLHLLPWFLQAWTISVFMKVSCFLYLSGPFTAAKKSASLGLQSFITLFVSLKKIHIKSIN